jgi:hypothetical protein
MFLLFSCNENELKKNTSSLHTIKYILVRDFEGDLEKINKDVDHLVLILFYK